MMIWFVLYGLIVFIYATSLVYSRPPHSAFDEMMIGLMSLCFPIVFLAFLIGNFAKLIGLHLIDPIIARSTKPNEPE